MQIKILIPIFKCESDQDIFFARVSRLSAACSATKAPECLQLDVVGQPDDAFFSELEEICNIWNTRFQISKEPDESA